jgi:hypothetical protein
VLARKKLRIRKQLAQQPGSTESVRTTSVINDDHSEYLQVELVFGSD